ncbi:Ig-like domain-containing protein [Bdellovibrio sp.]|uniref:Ig-like domain-containing protein n=1 Tax=Bdellovibrio sp. TaxID=28201 RepID=UPI0039E5E64F
MKDLHVMVSRWFRLGVVGGLALGLSACNISASLLSDQFKLKTRIDSETTPTHINDSNQGHFPIAGHCPKGAKEVVLEAQVTTAFSCVDGEFSGSLDLSHLSEGDHVFVLRPDVGESKTWVVVKDITPPTVKLDPVASFINLANASAFPVSGTCSESGQFVFIISGLLRVPVQCSSGIFGGSLNLMDLSEGAVSIAAVHADAAGNETSDSASTQKDTIRPGLAVLTNLPASPSPHISLNSVVSGTDVTEYAYKVGVASSVSCTDTSSGYSSFREVSINLITDISSLPDTTLKLCVWTQDIAGNRQLDSDIYEYTWNKDSTIALATISDFDPVGNISNVAVDRKVSVGGVNITSYKAVVLHNYSDCSSADFGGAVETPVTTDFTFPISSDGTYLVCVIGKNVANFWQPVNAATASNLLTIDRVPPSLALVSTAPETFNTSSFSATATFSESVAGLELSDIVVTNGTVSDFSGSGTTYTFTVTPTAQGLVTVAVGAGVATDAASNGNTVATNLSRIFDSVSPGVTLSGGSANTNGAFAATLTFSEAVSGVELGDFAVTNAILTSLSGGPSVYTVTATPVVEGAVSLQYQVGKAQDAGGNSNTASNTLNSTYDSIAPTVSLSSIAGDPFKNSSFDVTATFSESVTGFAASDITVTNGTVSGFSGSGATYTFTVTPAAQGLVTIAVNAGVATDAAGNGNTAATSLTRTYDSVQPSLSLFSASGDPFNTSTFSVTATFSESVTGFAAGDISVTNGTVSGFSGSGTTYTFTVTPAAQGLVTVAVNAGVATDAAGNGNTAATNLTRTYDSIKPSLALSSASGNPFNAASFSVTATFSESVTGFAAGDISVTNGTVSGFSGSGTTYTFTVTPAAQGLVTVAVNAGVATDAAGNGNTAATNLTRTYDSVGPTITGLSSDPIWKTSKTWSWGCSETCTYRFVVDTNAGTIPSGGYGSTTTTSQSSGSGTHYLHVQAQDEAGNTSITHVSVLLDNTNPTAPTSIIDGITLSSLTQSPTITFTSGTDAHSGVQKHQLRVLRVSDSFVMKDWHDFTSGNAVTGLSLTTNTSYKVEIKTLDNLNRESLITASDGWVADATAPGAASGLSLGSVPNNLTTSPTLSWSAAGDGSGSGVAFHEARVFRALDHAAMSAWTVLSSGGSISGMTLVGGTQYYFKVRATDKAGNVGSESAASSSWTAVSCVPGSKTFSYTGGDQTFTVPSGCSSITVKMWGAGGGGANLSGYYPYAGGGGGFTTGVLSVTPNENLTVIVGQGGRGSVSAPVAATYGGGGAVGLGDWAGASGGQGGGRSALKRGGTEVLTAGGGGGAGHAGGGGAGGGLSGLNATSYYAAGGASQVAGGAAGTGGTVAGYAGTQFTGATGRNYSGGYIASSGSGGGGYYGGGSGAVSEEPWSCEVGGGGGGSGYLGSAASASTVAGSGATPGNAGDGDRSGAGQGGSDYNVSGAHGVVIISW